MSIIFKVAAARRRRSDCIFNDIDCNVEMKWEVLVSNMKQVWKYSKNQFFISVRKSDEIIERGKRQQLKE